MPHTLLQTGRVLKGRGCMVPRWGQELASAVLTSGLAGAGKLSQSRSSHLSFSQSEAQTLTRRSELVASQSSPPSTPNSWYYRR